MLCMIEVTYYHVHFESWYGYPLDWEDIQKNYPSMAPKNLGSMGYVGFTSIYIPKPVQEQAYATEGLALQFFRSYNTSWHNPAKYFGLISSVDTSKLMPCSASVMSDSAAMKRHVQFTNDQDGVVITNDTWPSANWVGMGFTCMSLHWHVFFNIHINGIHWQYKTIGRTLGFSKPGVHAK